MSARRLFSGFGLIWCSDPSLKFGGFTGGREKMDGKQCEGTESGMRGGKRGKLWMH